MNNTTVTIFPKIDIHSHIIPLVDDGCENYFELDEAIKQVVDNKVKQIVCTPHFESIIDNNELYSNYEYVKNQLDKCDVKSYLGFEFKLNYKNISLLKQEILNNKYKNLKYLLVEFNRDESLTKKEAFMLIEEIMDLGYKVVLAHPEFYINYRDVKFIENLRKNGVIIQCDASSFIKDKTDKKSYKFVYKLLDKGLVNIVSSDYHDNTIRNYDNLNTAFYNVANRISLSCAKHLFYGNPKYIIDNFILPE
jgi:protein-tyrosine phosphatase